MAESFSYESQNIYVALASYSKKKYLEYLDGGYSFSESDMDILRACSKNSSFQGEHVVNASSVAENATASRAYSRTQAVSRSMEMRAKTRLDYWDSALKAAEKDEVFYAGRTAADLSLHRDITTTPDEVSITESFSIDPETGEVSPSTVVV
jgi:hypothetical protein